MATQTVGTAEPRRGANDDIVEATINYLGPGVPHSAFDDPTCPPGSAPRTSIEARVFAVY
jgi:hypothetical protein